MATLWDYQRQLRRVAASRNRSAVQELRQVYADVLQQLQGILGKYYTAYGSGTESTLSQADLRLAGQYQSFLYDVQKQLDGLSAPVQSRIRQTIADTYTLCYDGMAAAVRQAAQDNRTLQEALRGLSDTTPETVRHLVEHPMQELTLSDVFQRQRSRVIREIKKTLTTGLAVGDSYTRMSQAIADVLGGDLAKAQRIVRTEAHRAISRGFQGVSDQTAYLLRESPYMEVKEWCSAEDGDVRSAHRKLDGVVLPVAEEFEVDGKRAACPCGFGVAELDINCRCFLKYSLVLRSEFEDRRHKAKQEQPAAQNTPQVQAGQMTLSTASGQQTPAHAVEVQPTAPPEDGGTGTVYLPEKISGKPLTSWDSGGIIKMGKAKKQVIAQAPADFSKYTISEDVESVQVAKNSLISSFGLEEEKVSLDGICNAEVLKPFADQLIRIHEQTGFKLPNIHAVEMIDGDPCCIAGYKPMENRFYISSRYFNSKEALLDTLKSWASSGILPKQGESIRYLAEHESAHMRIPDKLLQSEEAQKIQKAFLHSKSYNDNDAKIEEFFADAIAIYRMNPSTTDTCIVMAVEYLKKAGIT